MPLLVREVRDGKTYELTTTDNGGGNLNLYAGYPSSDISIKNIVGAAGKRLSALDISSGKSAIRVSVTVSGPMSCMLELRDPLGRSVLFSGSRQSLAAGENCLQIPAAGLAAGCYLLSVKLNEFSGQNRLIVYSVK
jgi:hypothetical protein